MFDKSIQNLFHNIGYKYSFYGGGDTETLHTTFLNLPENYGAIIMIYCSYIIRSN